MTTALAHPTYYLKKRHDSAFDEACSEWIKLFPGVDYPREADWMEVRRMFGGGLMAVGMKDGREGENGM